ncbi:phage tail assembly protein [Marinobacterium sedimentorum]|uniref:phage tail assembly protein n=1 Tax=Marinobacterium sedimentorum TaxID=2927804 RepID=UPI0020C72EEF|nr:phage tail assembly protein [Marinobacterium sedimentorum]MCP8687742.1 phage tail assembly protein [Marinobacterium sedimentorum]
MTDTPNTQPADDVVIVENELPPNSHELDEPLPRGKDSITLITLRKPKSGELRGLSLQDVLNLDYNSLEALLPRISSPTLTKQDVANLDPADLTGLGTIVVGFFVAKEKKAEAYLPA